jgi:hypothetical protein
VEEDREALVTSVARLPKFLSVKLGQILGKYLVGDVGTHRRSRKVPCSAIALLFASVHRRLINDLKSLCH